MTAMAWVLDLDGVVWRGEDPIPGASGAVAQLRAAGHRVWFVTNNGLPRRGDVVAKLRAHGIDADDDVVTSPMAAASLVKPGERVLVCGGAGVTEAVEERGAEAIDASATAGAVDAVIVGLHLDFDYRRLANACTAIRAGARFIATNDDSTYPATSGLLPGAGSLVAAVATASGASPTVAGKPHEPMVTLVRSLAGPGGIVVGDRADTDGRFARALGYRFGLVLTGVTGVADLPVDPAPDLIVDDLAGLVAEVLAGSDSPPLV
jgi:HAD superfamily hydrolase (TIGR01450 family)